MDSCMINRQPLNRLMHSNKQTGDSAHAPVKERGSGRYLFTKKLATVVIVLFGVSLLLTACSSNTSTSPNTEKTSSSKAATSSKNGTSSSNASFTAYSNCMKQHGVNFGGFHGGGSRQPGSGGGTSSTSSSGTGTGGTGANNGYFHNLTTNPAFKKAEAACAGLRPKYSSNGFSRNSAAAEKFAAYSNCLKLHGVNLPTPTKKTSGTTGSSTSTAPSSTPGISPLSSTLNSSNPTVKAALAACASLKPIFSPPGSTAQTGS